MSDRRGFPGAQFQGDRPREQEAVRTTIVGGRPPGSGQSLGGIPRTRSPDQEGGGRSGLQGAVARPAGGSRRHVG